MSSTPKKPFDPIGALLAVAVGASGGALAKLLGLPLPWLLGSIVAMAAVSIAGFAPRGHIPRIPEASRSFFIPVIGVGIGATFTPEVLAEMPGWWPTIAALAVFIPLVHLLGFFAIRSMGGTDPATAFFGTAPGGLIEAVVMGEEAGADGALLTLMQFLRLILCIVLIPIGFSFFKGEAVGSASGVVLGEGIVLRIWDWFVLAACAAGGYFLGTRTKLPAALMTGPLLLSALAHLFGLVKGAPPGWLIDTVQLGVGVALGARFWGKPPVLLVRALRYTIVNVTIALLIAGLVAATLSRFVDEGWEAVFLAYAPGGLAEMSLVALSLEISVIYVTLHHVVRIILAVMWARLMAPHILKER